MTLHLHPKAVPSGKVRVWLGITGVSGATPVPQVSAKGLSSGRQLTRASATIRPLSRVRQGAPGAGVCTGMYEFDGFRGGERVEVTAKVAGMSPVTKNIPVLPASLPTASGGGASGWFRVLLVSCYHYSMADAYGIRLALKAAMAEGDIGLSIFMGDQVYLDLPWYRNYPNSQEWMESKFEELYSRNWFGIGGDTSYADLLQTAPHACLPDDHEYWNNFPEPAPQLQNTYTAVGRSRWQQAARLMYEGFQQHAADLGAADILDVKPLSIFLADSRTERDSPANRNRAFSAATLAALNRWVSHVNSTPNGMGMFVTGQSLLDKKAGWFMGRVADKALADYADYDLVWGALAQLAKPFILVTGDIHCGRVVRLERMRSGGTRGWEVIVSPLALCEGNGRLISFDRDWPRHSRAEEPEFKYLPWDVRAARSQDSNPPSFHGQKGDQLGVLSFRTVNGAVQAFMDYFPVSSVRSIRERWRRRVPISLI